MGSSALKWYRLELDTLGDQLSIHGQLFFNGEEKTLVPLDWRHGVIVYLSKRPDERLDWSGGINLANSMGEKTLSEEDGSFRATFDLRETDRDRNRTESFQFGIGLATHDSQIVRGQEVLWSTRAPAIESSVAKLEIARGPELPHEIDLIYRAHNWPFAEQAGVDLIRAVNALQALGKDRAIDSLERYVELIDDRSSFEDDVRIVFWIIRALFEPARLGETYPVPFTGIQIEDRRPPEKPMWPLNPESIVHDVPFMVGSFGGRFGVQEHPAKQIEWVQLHCVIRDQPLLPSVDPLTAAESIIASQKFQMLDSYTQTNATRRIRKQAFAMLGDLGPEEPQDDSALESGDEWKRILAGVKERGFVWNEMQQRFLPQKKEP